MVARPVRYGPVRQKKTFLYIRCGEIENREVSRLRQLSVDSLFGLFHVAAIWTEWTGNAW